MVQEASSGNRGTAPSKLSLELAMADRDPGDWSRDRNNGRRRLRKRPVPSGRNVNVADCAVAGFDTNGILTGHPESGGGIAHSYANGPGLHDRTGG